jgi:hypothetical protein
MISSTYAITPAGVSNSYPFAEQGSAIKLLKARLEGTDKTIALDLAAQNGVVPGYRLGIDQHRRAGAVTDLTSTLRSSL